MKASFWLGTEWAKPVGGDVPAAEMVGGGKAVVEYSPTKEKEPRVRGKSPPPFPEGGGLSVVV